MKPKPEALRVNVTTQLKAALEAEAERGDTSVAHIVRKAIRDYLLAREASTAP